MTISRNINFITAEAISDRKQATLFRAIELVYAQYRKRGFRITTILADGEFENQRGDIATKLKTDLNICGVDEHVPCGLGFLSDTKPCFICLFGWNPTCAGEAGGDLVHSNANKFA